MQQQYRLAIRSFRRHIHISHFQDFPLYVQLDIMHLERILDIFEVQADRSGITWLCRQAAGQEKNKKKGSIFHLADASFSEQGKLQRAKNHARLSIRNDESR